MAAAGLYKPTHVVLVCDADLHPKAPAIACTCEADALTRAAREARSDRDAVVLVKTPDGAGLRVSAWG
jgi:hypothetical protein